MNEGNKTSIEKLGDTYSVPNHYGWPIEIKFTDAEMVLKNKINEIIDKVKKEGLLWK